MKLISVVIPCYNHGEFLEEAVESVLHQSYQHFEIVIVNDGSTDPFTNDLLMSFDKPRCRVIHTDNHGLSAARNRGIRSTEGDYICCLDADDMYYPDYFSKAAFVLDHDKNLQYGAVPAWVQFFGSSTTLWKTVGHNSDGFEPFLQGIRNNIQSATMFRRICWERVSGFNESMILGYEDWDFWIKTLDLGYKWFCLEEPLIYYRQKDNSMVTRADEMRSRLLEVLIKNNFRFYTKHLVPILQERDNEVLQLAQKNRKLMEEIVMITKGNEFGMEKSGVAAFGVQLRHTLRKLFPFI